MEWFTKFVAQVKTLWGKWSRIQRIVLIVICAVAIVGLWAIVAVSSTPTYVAVIDAPIQDEDARYRITNRINQEGVSTYVNAAGVIQVQDEATARRMRSILIREDLIPSGTDPWAIFDRERWTLTDFERNVNLQRAITQMVTDHIKALDDIDNVNVIIDVPQERLFAADQNPITASVVITPKPGSDIIQNRKKIEGIQKLLKYAITGLKDENIAIVDHTGYQLNDFAGLAEWDRLTRIERETKMIQQLETQYRGKILAALQRTYGIDRVRDLNIKIDMDMSQKSVNTTEFFGITIRPRTPGLAYDDSEIIESVTTSSSMISTSWEGTGFNPEGPEGVEGNAPPVMRDLTNMYGAVQQQSSTINEEHNKRVIEEEKSPTIDRVTVSVNIDGTWRLKLDENRSPIMGEDGALERIYTPVSPEDLRSLQGLIRDAIGFSAARGDSVSVYNIAFDRRIEQQDEDEAFFRQQQFRTTLVIFFSGLAVLLIAFILFRTISREIERRKRQEAEERARREEALRQQALMQAEEEGMDVNISVEERTRMETMENVLTMAREHPEDVAQLIRTWILED
jgi:flagellar M-ring protein FliF